MHDIIIETERLILRPITVADAEAAFEWVGDERVTKYMPYFTYTSIEQVRQWLKRVEQETHTYNFGFERKSDGLLIGSGDIGVEKKPYSNNDYWCFGYNIRYDCWNQGYTTEATKGMMKYVYEHFGARYFYADHAEQNKASGRVMEKCGLHFVRYGEVSKLDGSGKMRSMEYEGEYDPSTVG
ncbi:MAG: GNAT family N-acetyltransferase [Eubacterium sp.]|nr:GNAT family N-acetyltransferase [Eubacterium sp.]